MAEFGKQSVKEGSKKYFVLMMLTDGEITDMKATVQAVNRMSQLPISIVVVGVGQADFSSMRLLDEMNEGTDAKSRDILQFVPFRVAGVDPKNLAAEVLKEIPGQLVQYYDLKGIAPVSR